MQRLSGMDATFVYGEASGWPLHMGALAVFDPSTSPEGLGVERVRELFRQRLALIGALRHRLVRTPGGLGLPVWVETDVDVADHIHAVRVPAPGGPHELAGLLSDLMPPRLDPNRPLWEKWVIEGLEGGRVAVLDRLHHSTTDGVRGMEIQAASYDLSADAPFTRPGTEPVPDDRVPRPYELLAGAARDLAATPVRAARAVGHLARAGQHLASAARRGELSGLAVPFAAPRTSLNGPISIRRAFAYCSLPLAPVKAVAKREGATVNDVVLTLAGGALREYLSARGELPARSLIAAVPVGLAGGGANQLAMMSAVLGTDIADPLERLRAVAGSERASKKMLGAAGNDLMMELVGLAPPAMVGAAAAAYGRLRLSRFHPPIVNVVVSNVRGAPMALYLAGARMEATYPLGPVADGLGLNLTVISYLDHLDVGFAVCPDLVEDPWRLVAAIEHAAAELTPRRRSRARR